VGTAVLRISDLPLPSKVKDLLVKQGISTLFPPQEEAIKAGVLQGRNLVLAIPTASGKTLIAELCMVKAILERRGKALYLCPLRSLASEKYEEFRRYAQLGIKVGITIGDYDSADEALGAYDLLVCTNERADSLLRHQASWMSQIAIVVADEVHLINDPKRGPTLEVVLARLRQIAPQAQFLALSATIANPDEIASWLNGQAITSDWRPVVLKEGVLLEGNITYDDGSHERLGPFTSFPIGDVARHVLRQQGQLLVFLNTRRSAVTTARRLSPIVSRYLNGQERTQLEAISERLLHLGEVTKVTTTLANLIRAGVAFHHAGLRYAERKLIEEAFRQTLLKAVCATPTLAAGVNLPARFVIIKDYRRYDQIEGYQPIPILEYKQMAGRAGRPKYDKVGKALLIARNREEQDFLLDSYINGQPERILSKLASVAALRSHILSTIAMGYARSKKGIMRFLSQTFYGYQHDPQEVASTVDTVLNFLLREDLLKQSGNRLSATHFGRRVSQLYIDPKSAVILRDGLHIAAQREATPLSYLHLTCHTPDMPNLYLRRADTHPLDRLVDQHIDEFLLPIPDPTFQPYEYEFFLAEVKTAQLIMGWIEETPEDQLIDRFGIGSGDLLRLVETQAWLLYACRELARIFQLDHLTPQLTELETRVRHGVRPELTPLVTLQGIGRIRARLLYRAGFTTRQHIRDAPLKQLAVIPTIGPQIARSIKIQCGGQITPEEEEQALKSRPNQEARQTQLPAN